MGVYSTLLFAGGIPGGGNTVVAGPWSQVAVVRDIEANEGGASEDFAYVTFEPASGTIAGFHGEGVEPGWHQWTGRVVLPPGQYLVCGSDALPWDFVISGYLLT